MSQLVAEAPIVSSAPTESEMLNPNRIPKHVAIIMDGNRRWAKSRGVPTMVGHWKGAEALSELVEAAADIGIKVLTVYAFSTENWSRASDEVDSLMQLFKMYLSSYKERMLKEGVRLGSIGNLDRLPPDVRSVLEDTKNATAACGRIELVLAINYGARDDIRRAAVQIAKKCQNGELSPQEITEEVIARHLDTAPWGDPDLLIRTSGEKRLSNFLLWQISYSEVYITDVLWPDFDERQLVAALIDYQKRSRRTGG